MTFDETYQLRPTDADRAQELVEKLRIFEGEYGLKVIDRAGIHRILAIDDNLKAEGKSSDDHPIRFSGQKLDPTTGNTYERWNWSTHRITLVEIR